MPLRPAQTMLRDAGFDPGPLDGKWGPRTRDALAAALAIAKQAAPVSETPAQAVVRLCIDPALKLLPARMDSPEARVLMLAICGQEADFHHRWQVIDPARPEVMGPARGLWQFERDGGVRGVLTHERTKRMAIDVCRMRNVPATIDAVYNRLHEDDILAAAFARLLLWSNPAALPAIGDVEGAWQAYLREWRPGAWTNGNTTQREGLRRKWAGYYATALATLR